MARGVIEGVVDGTTTHHYNCKRRRNTDDCHQQHRALVQERTLVPHISIMSFILCIINLFIGHSMALMNVRISTRSYNEIYNLQTHHVSINRVGRRSHQTIITSLYSSNIEDEDDFNDVKGSSDKDSEDDNISDGYFEKFISEALKDEQSDDSSSRESIDDSNSELSNTQKMMEQQQKQIDMLMKLVQQQGQQPPQTTASDRGRIRDEKSTISQPQTTSNVAPLKAMLFIDGTWLYYSLNSRNAKRDSIIPKFGVGWQNNYKVDWLALPRLICAQIEKQRNSQTSYSSGSSDRPLEISRVMVFTSAKKETDPNSIRMRMFRDMANANFDVHMMETVGTGEKCVDIQLAVEMLHYATVPNAYDVAILLSGDKDFVPALVRTRQKGKQVCISSMRAGCNRVLYESPHIRDYDVVWLENVMDQLIIPISAEERGRRDRAGYASSFTMMRVVRDFIESAPDDNEWVSSRDIGKYLKNIDIADSNMLEELKQAHGGLRTFLMERALTLFEVKFPDSGTVRGRDEFSFNVRVKGNTDETLLNEFKRTQFFTKEEKEFLESYNKKKYIEDDSFDHTTGTSSYVPPPPIEEFTFESLPAIDYSQLTVAKLKDICREKDLPVSGKKDVLIERLEEDRKLEYEVIEKLQREARAAKRTFTKKLPRPKTAVMKERQQSTPISPAGNNVYASVLPQYEYQNPRATINTGEPVDPAIGAHLEGLIKEYLTASGGEAGSRDVGRYLAANSDSKNGNTSALTELKESYGSLLAFIGRRGNIFTVLDKKKGRSGQEKGFPIRLNNN